VIFAHLTFAPLIFAQLDLLNQSELVFPTLEVFHILGFAIALGTIAIVDFRMLGWGLRRQKTADLAKDLEIYTMLGLGLVILSGSLLFLSDPDEYYLNRAFQIKMVFLVLAIIFHYTLHQRTALRDGSPVAGSIVASVSLALWLLVIGGGIFVGFA